MFASAILILSSHVALAPPAQTAGDQAAGVVRFEIVDEAGRGIPARLAFRTADDPRPALFPNTDADPSRLAVRRNVIYAITGRGAVTVPTGTYDLVISRGLEWSIARRTLEVREGREIAFTASLDHELDTTGWISGDFHLHTLTFSGHGDSNLPERIISLVGEGVEFAVATDHNHHTDYAPTMHEVGADPHMAAVTGNEISTSIGHFNAFPLEPGHVVPYRLSSAQPLFALVREEPNRFDVVPVIQINHPRWAEINYFDKAGLDPITGLADSEVWSPDFDTIEVLNENEGWGFFDPDETDLEVRSGTFSVLNDWFNLLNNGRRYAAVGNSDSHHVESEIAGYPRNFVASPTDDPTAIDPADVAEALRANRVFTTTGPFVDFDVDGATMGETLTLDSTGQEVTLGVRVQAASWIDCDRVKVVLNGDVVHTFDVPQSREVGRLRAAWTFTPAADCWVALVVEGDDPLTDVVHDQNRPILPLAVTNPVWIDADADGAWTSPRDQAVARIQAGVSAPEVVETPSGAAQALLVQAAAANDEALGVELVPTLLEDDDRRVRLGAARAAETLADGALADSLRQVVEDAGDDMHLRVAALRALSASGVDVTSDVLDLLASSERADLTRRFGPSLHRLLAPDADFVRSWKVVAFFPSPQGASLASTRYAPESDRNLDGAFEGKSGRVRWTPIEADASGYVDLTTIDVPRETRENSIAYLATTLISADDREVGYAIGTDDGCRLFVNGTLVLEDEDNHAARPYQHVGRMQLKQGENRILIKIRNGAGDVGAYFRVLDAAVTVAR